MTGFRYFLYGCGQFGIMAMASFLFQWLIHFADTDQLFVASQVGSAFFAFRIFDGLSDPLAGLLGDTWVRRGHERRSLLWYAFLLPPIGLLLTFAPTLEMTSAARWGLLIAGMTAFFVGYTIYAIPYWSLLKDYSQGCVKTRRHMSNMLGIGVMVATAITFLVSPPLIDKFGFFTAALIFVVPASLFLVLPYFAKPKVATNTSPQPLQQPTPMDFRQQIKRLAKSLSQRKLLAIIGLFCGAQMSFTIMRSAAPYIATQLLGGTKSDVALLLGPLIATSIVTFAAVPWFANRLGWERATKVACVTLAVIYVGASGLGQAIVGSSMTTAMLLFGLAGPMTAVIVGLEGEAVTSCASEIDPNVTSVYFGIFNFCVKSLNGLAIFITGILATAARGSMGDWAIRSMTFVAGATLILGVCFYVGLRSKSSHKS